MYTESGGHRIYFVDGRNNWDGDTAQHRKTELSCQEIIPLRGSILQAETCQILSLAENPRWSPSVAIIASLTEAIYSLPGIVNL